MCRFLWKHGWLSFCHVHNVSLCRLGLLLSAERDGQRSPLALWKLSCRSTPTSPLSAERGARRLVFPAQSGSKLWPSLCALGTRPTAIPILPLAFPTQSRTVPSPLAPSFMQTICLFTGYHPRGHLVLVILRYGNVPASWNISTTVRVTQGSMEITHLEVMLLLTRRCRLGRVSFVSQRRKKAICIFV